MAERIIMDKPIVEIDGDEMARVMWHWVKENLIIPYVDLKTEYYDLHIKKRDETNDQITVQAAEAIKKWMVGVKCATITPNAERVKEYNLKKEWKSPNATIRKMLDGTIFRAPIIMRNIPPAVRFWKKPIIIARHAFGDIYDGIGVRFNGPAEAELTVKQLDGETINAKFPKITGAGVIQGIYNIDKSIESFARASFKYALENKLDLWFAAKETISKVYDARFKEIFRHIYEEEFKEKYREAGITYQYYLIDDALARAVRSEGGFVWACKNFDGDVLSDFIAAAYVGTLALMSSVLFSPEGHFLSEAAHGTVQRHYYCHLKGEKTSTNPTAIIFAWAAALKRRGELDGITELVKFASNLEKAVKVTIEDDRVMTADLAKVAEPPVHNVVDTQGFINAVKRNLEKFTCKSSPKP
ncbi:NADP-dependent isocitrate dehydrogenase [Candidatus Bathyarchaeota archaeon]|nr:NADP-dependent isocitrate dehydrogenase [Candidatus Bathyarchaeota archaeon]